ncbi:MAG: PQQ-binding-like beta-propeller repeat protein, partial [Polyangiales bacterium]
GGTTSSGTGGSPSGGPGGGPGTSSASVLQYHNNASRDGLYIDAAFKATDVPMLHRDKTFNATITGPTYAQPLYFEGGPGGKDVLIVATEQNEVSALNATDGSVAWRKMLGAPAASSSLPCGNINPLGTTGTPIIDAASRTVFLDTMTTDSGAPKHMIHALSIDDGSEKTGWPVDVNASAKAGSTAFDSSVQNERGALAILNGTLYVPYGGHWGDCGNYHGWVVGVPIANPSAPTAWATRARAGGIWAPGGIASDGTSLFVATGNTMGATSWSDGEAIIRLPTSLAFSQMDPDYFAPSNWQTLDSGDVDIGGSGPVLFSGKGATPSALAISLGKDGTAYLLDRTKLGGIGKPLHSLKASSQQIIQAATAYSSATTSYVAFRGAGTGCPNAQGQVTALKVSAASPPQLSVAWCAGSSGSGSPITTTTDGTTDPIVWWVSAESGNKLFGFNGETGDVIFGGGGADEQMMTVNRFQTPIVAKGRIFVAGANAVYAFSVK